MFVFKENNHEYYAGNIIKQYESGRYILRWESAPGCGVLIFNTTSGEDLNMKIKEICDLLNEKAFSTAQTDDFKEIGNGLFVKALSVTGNQLNPSVEVRRRGRYYVYPYKNDNGTSNLYGFAPGGIGNNYTDINEKIDITIQEVRKEVTEGFLKKKTFSKCTGYYSVTFPSNYYVGNYKSGELYYEAKGVKIPLTANMIIQGTIYIKSDSEPEIKSDNSTVEVIIKCLK